VGERVRRLPFLRGIRSRFSFRRSGRGRRGGVFGRWGLRCGCVSLELWEEWRGCDGLREVGDDVCDVLEHMVGEFLVRSRSIAKVRMKAAWLQMWIVDNILVIVCVDRK